MLVCENISLRKCADALIYETKYLEKNIVKYNTWKNKASLMS